MPRLNERDYTYFTTVRGMCRRCRSVGPSRVFFRDGKVWQESLCPCGPQEPALIASDSRWYLSEVVRAMPDRSPLVGAQPPRLGCPHDCGPCTWHASPCQLPVLSITNACNLRCPICFTYNRDDRVWNMPVEEMRRTVDWIVAASGRVDLINITGGEPTLHPELEAILQTCQRPEIGRITMNSNGIRLAEDFDLCRRLADLGVYVIFSLNTLDAEISRRLHGRDLVGVKRRAIENLARAGVRMTLLNVLIRDVNEYTLADLLELMREHDHILSLTVQTMTYTGQGGGTFGQGTGVLGTGPFFGQRTHLAERTSAENMDLSPLVTPVVTPRGQSHFRGGQRQWRWQRPGRRENWDSPRQTHSRRRGGRDRLPPIGRMDRAGRLHRPARRPSTVLSGLLSAEERRSAAAVHAIRPAGRGSRTPDRFVLAPPDRRGGFLYRRDQPALCRRPNGASGDAARPGRAAVSARPGNRRFPAAAAGRRERAHDLPPRPHGRGHVRLLPGDALSRSGAGRARSLDPRVYVQPVLPHEGREVLRHG